jgi:hypothetical protein
MKRNLFLLLLLIPAIPAISQIPADISGYASEMPSVIFMSNPRDILWQNQVHNRLNLGWQAGKYFRLEAGMRTRFSAGSKTILNADETGYDRNWIDLSWNLFAAETGRTSFPQNSTALLNVALDRLNVTYEKERLLLRIGRQRINWGQNFVWNPNDIFNTCSFFDFDYPERPGCDAFRGTYYHSPTSATELAVSLDRRNKVTAAALHRFNRKDFDFQFIAGIMNNETEIADWVVGGAWAGDIKGVSFRGEFSYFHPLKKADAEEASQESFAVSLGLDYSFENSLMIQAEALYQTANPNGGSIERELSASSQIFKSSNLQTDSNESMNNGLLSLYSAPLSAKTLSFSKLNVFLQASYPFSPRLRGSVSGIIYPDRDAFYAGFSFDYSLAQNLDLSLYVQNFYIKFEPEALECVLGFVRLKYSF